MFKTGVVPSVMLGALLALGVVPASARSDHFRSDGWSLRVRPDRFTGRTRCVLASTNRHLRYQPGAVGFRLGKHRDTLPTWYRIDDSNPVRWQDRTASLIAAGVALDGPALDNPTGGWVWIPIAEVEAAKSVAIRADEHGRIHHFQMAGFAPMLAAATRLGCGSDDAFRI